jgi:hypothetical protein
MVPVSFFDPDGTHPEAEGVSKIDAEEEETE